MKKSILKYAMLTLIASFTLALTACGGGGSNPEKSKEPVACSDEGGFNLEKSKKLCTKYYSDGANFSESDAKAMLDQYKASSEEIMGLYKKYNGEIPTTDECEKMIELNEDMDVILGCDTEDIIQKYPKIEKEFSDYKDELDKRIEELTGE